MAKRSKVDKATSRPSKGAKKNAPNPKWWEQAEEVPRAGLPDARKLERKAKRMRRFVWASIFLCPFALLATFVSAAGNGKETPAVVSVDRYVETKPVAIVAVRAWLAQSPQPLPGGLLVGWDSATEKDSPVDVDSPEDAYTVEVHRLTVADSTGALYDTVVTLGVADTIGTVVIGQPTLIPQAPSDTSWEESSWPGLESAAVTEEMEASILAWATAYSSGDPAALRLAIADSDPSRNYVPLSGAILAEADIGDAVAIFPDDDPVEQQDDLTPDTVVVRVVFEIQWRSITPAEGEDWPFVTYDLLVKKADTAAPVVVAWGGPGTGPDLKAYGNALTGRSVEANVPEEDGSIVEGEQTNLGEDASSTSPPASPVVTTPPKNKKPKGQNR